MDTGIKGNKKASPTEIIAPEHLPGTKVWSKSWSHSYTLFKVPNLESPLGKIPTCDLWFYPFFPGASRQFHSGVRSLISSHGLSSADVASWLSLDVCALS